VLFSRAHVVQTPRGVPSLEDTGDEILMHDYENRNEILMHDYENPNELSITIPDRDDDDDPLRSILRPLQQREVHLSTLIEDSCDWILPGEA
jgi:hypothetical protein